MKAIDLQFQCTTKWGSLLTPEQAEQIGAYLGTKLNYNITDEETAKLIRNADVKAMIIIPTSDITKDIGRVREINDRAAQFQKDYPNEIVGIWASINPQLGYKGMRELERCFQDLGFIGYYMMSLAAGCYLNDKSMYYLYDICSEAGKPARLNVGHTAGGAGLPGGGGFHLGGERPIPFLDDVAADFPNMTVIAAHCSWPWHNEVISMLLHKSNVYAENHGWAPKYIPAEIKKEINGRLQDKYMFASDYPFLQFDRVFKDWDAEIKPGALEKMYYKNAQRVFGLKL